MPMLDPFAGNGFTLTTLTAAINKLPNRYGRLEELNLFPTAGLTTRTLMVEEKNGVLCLVPTQPWGSPGSQNTGGTRLGRAFAVPHMPLDDSLQAADVNGIRAFGTENAVDPVTLRVQEKLQDMKDKLDQTLEWRRMGALKGEIVDADGSSVIYNLFNEFGITKKSVDFALGTAGTDVRAKCMEVKRHIEDNLLGERMTNIHVLVSEEFYDKLVSHSKVQAAFQNWQAAQERIGGDMRSGFTFGGLTFEEYRAKTASPSGTLNRYIAAGDGHAFPMGTATTFKTYAAPADFVETINTIGVPYYAKMERQKFDRGMDLHTQSNVLPLCLRPGVLVRVHTSN